jgi:hypothetical protein
MKQALEALEKATPVRAKDPQMQADAIVALRTAIEAAEKQEPVAFNRKAVWNVLFEVWNQNISASEGLQKLQDLYTTPPAQEFVCSTGLCHYKAKRPWVGLTDEDCKGLNVGDMVVAMWADRILKEKNT